MSGANAEENAAAKENAASLQENAAVEENAASLEENAGAEENEATEVAARYMCNISLFLHLFSFLPMTKLNLTQV